MKNTFLSSIFILFPFLLGGIVISCQSDLDDEVKIEQQKVLKAQIEKAQKIFEYRSPDFPTIQSRTVDGVEKGIVFEPVWDESFVANHADGTTTVETHVRLSQPFHMVPQDSHEAYERTKDQRYLRHLSRAVVLMPDDNSTSYAFLMTIVGSKKYMETHDFQLWEVSYNQIPEDFSGMILYHSLGGNFVNGWYVDEGRVFSTCEPISEEDARLLSRSTWECRTLTGYRYVYQCHNGNNDYYKTYEDESLKIGSSTVCNGPFYESYNYVACSINENGTPSGGSGSGGYYDPISDPDRLFTSYSTYTLNSQLKGFMAFMEHNDYASKGVLNFIENSLQSLGVYNKLNVQIDATQTVDVRYSSSDNTVYFKSDSHFSDMALYEEVVHSAQRVVYPDYLEGPLNIEFEAKLIMDYVRLVNGSKGLTDMAMNMEYAEIELQDGGTKTLSEWLQSVPYSYFNVSDFWNYVSVWKEISATYGDLFMGFAMEPKLIFPIIEEMNELRN